MGRLEYLKRMAFGRSPYSNHEDDANILTNHIQDGSQQYDAKGHPINPAKEQLSASLRQAQNEVLAIVGVLERKDSTSTALHQQQIRDREVEQMQERRLDQLELESADMLGRYAAIASMIWTWYPHTLLLRSLTGVYDQDDSFTSIVSRDLSTSANAPILHMLDMLWPGLLFRVVYNELSTFSSGWIDHLLNPVFSNDAERKQNNLTAHIARLTMQAAAQWCLLPLLQLSISAQLNPSRSEIPNAQTLSSLSSQLRDLFRANLSSQGLLTIAVVSLTGAFYSGSLNFLVQQRAAPPAKSVVQYTQYSSTNATYSRARSSTSLFPQIVERLGRLRASLLAWLDLDISNQVSTYSSRNHMDAGAAHPAVDPQFNENARSVSDLHAFARPSLHTHVALERFLSMTDAILMQSIQLPVECLFLRLSARPLGPSPNLTSHHHIVAKGNVFPLTGTTRNGVSINTINRVGLSLSLVYLAEMAAFGAGQWIVDHILTRNLLG